MAEQSIKITNGWTLGFWAVSGAAGFMGLSMILGMLVAPVVNNWRPADQTDGGKQDRSGLTVFTDRGTGCQYVSASGSMTPRLGRDRLPICGRPQ